MRDDVSNVIAIELAGATLCKHKLPNMVVARLDFIHYLLLLSSSPQIFSRRDGQRVRLNLQHGNDQLTVPSIRKLALKLGTEGPHKTLPTSRLIQLQHSGQFIIKTTKSVLVWEHPYYPQLYLPTSIFADPIHKEFNIITEDHILNPETQAPIADKWTLKVTNGCTITNVLAFSQHLTGPAASLQSLVRIPFNSIDQWYEESTPIYVHPKDPFKRVDVLLSTRPIRVFIDQKLVASTTTSMHLYETGLPTRYYLPLSCIDASTMRPSATRTKCPYKGEAEYYHVDLGEGKVWEDVVWFYRTPLVECAKVEGEYLLPYLCSIVELCQGGFADHANVRTVLLL
jgi:uncharacterized protein (DUF427 family)